MISCTSVGASKRRSIEVSKRRSVEASKRRSIEASKRRSKRIDVFPCQLGKSSTSLFGTA